MQKARRHPTKGLRPLEGAWFQGLFHSPPGVLPTFPSRYLYTIGLRLVFSLSGWSPKIRAGFLVSRLTQVPAWQTARFSRTGLSPSAARLSSTLPLTSPAAAAPVLLPRGGRNPRGLG